MIVEAAPQPRDFSGISRLARDVLGPSDPHAASDSSTLAAFIRMGERAVVLRAPAWQPHEHTHAGTAELGAREYFHTETLTTKVVGFAVLHDRSQGRLDATVAADRSRPDFSTLITQLLAWVDNAANTALTARGTSSSMLVVRSGTADTPMHDALAAAGYERAREWLYMHRPLTPEDRQDLPRALPRIRRLITAEDRRAAHRVLETSFTDHFNSHEETFHEFESRIGTYPGHNWELDFLAEIPADGGWKPVGAIITSWLPSISTAHAEYLGVTSEARGHGVGRALLDAFFTEALDLGYPRAELFVDADSPTHAQDYYTRLGFVEHARDFTWHKTIAPTSIPTRLYSEEANQKRGRK